MTSRALVASSSAAARLEHATAWLRARDPSAPLVVIGATEESARDLVRRAMGAASFGWSCTTLPRYAALHARTSLAVEGRTLAPPLSLEALCARILHRRALDGTLGRFSVVADRPGLVRAIARVVQELRLSEVDHERLRAHDPDLASIVEEYGGELVAAGLADRATLFQVAIARATSGVALCLLDAPIDGALVGRFVRAVAERAELLATAPRADLRTVARLESALGLSSTIIDMDRGGPLARLQRSLFVPSRADELPAATGDELVLLSAPGEARECVEIARRIHREATAGVPFDRIAVALRAPAHYRPHLEEAFRRAEIPAHFAAGVVRPDPAGRAFLALLACAAEQLSAARFAEYLSLGQVPDPSPEGAPPAVTPSEARFVPADHELAPASPTEDVETSTIVDEESEVGARLRAPRRWERMIVDAAVIGGRDRWAGRLEGLRRDLVRKRDEADDETHARSYARTLDELDELRRFALPLLDALLALPARAPWSAWLDALSALATRALRRPQRVLATLAELAPMGPVGPIDAHEARLVLSSRLRDLVVPTETRRAGHVVIAPIEALRGASFDVVFVPGLAERLLPQKVTEEPILRDVVRAAIDPELAVSDARVENERLALHVAVGAAERRIVFSYPRLDGEQARPRVPSFYALEVIRAAEGALIGFDALTRRAERGGASRLAWPAPNEPSDAIDDAEHDLALLADLLRRPEDAAKGMARFLMDGNPHLARALRFRARRWGQRAFLPADGLVKPSAEAKKILLEKHALERRPYSPTALQTFAACPYRLFLHAIMRLTPREVPGAIEELDPLQRGSIVHEVQFELLLRLRDEGLLPLESAGFERARALLDRTLDEVAQRWREKLFPAIARVWDDAIASIRADVREWLDRAIDAGSSAAGDKRWIPWRFELSFGLHDRGARDPLSTEAPVMLDQGVLLRGSIDLVEEHGEGGPIRATDYKTGRVRAKEGSVVGGGEHLQPLLYALALEKIVPERSVDGGRLYYCTHAGEFRAIETPLDEPSRMVVQEVVSIVREHLDGAFLPAAPKEGACTYCDFKVVCGPDEERRVARKTREPLASLARLRGLK